MQSYSARGRELCNRLSFDRHGHRLSNGRRVSRLRFFPDARRPGARYHLNLMGLEIRDATLGDLAAIVEIEKLAFTTPWSLRSFERELSLPFSRLTVAVASGNSAEPAIAGFLCRWLIADECHVLNVAVHPSFRRKGVGEMLMNSAISEARAKHAAFVTLEVRRSNLAARQLYRKLNFEERRLRRHYYGPGEDAIVMELRLDGDARQRQL